MNGEIKPFEFKTGPMDFEQFKYFDNVYHFEEYKYEIHKWYNGKELCINEPIIPVASLVYSCFSDEPFYLIGRQIGQLDIIPKGENIIHIDGNMYNNDIDNLINDNNMKKEEA